MQSGNKDVLTPELIDLLATILANSELSQSETPISTPVCQGTESDFTNSDMSPYTVKLVAETCETDMNKTSIQQTDMVNQVPPSYIGNQYGRQSSQATTISPRGVSPQIFDYNNMSGVVATTLMIKNIPNRLSREQLLDVIQSEMPSGSFNFLYMPIDFKNRLNFGYAFINMTNDMYIDLFNLTFNKKRLLYSGGKPLDVVIARVQGFNANINRLIASPVLFTADDESLPIIFHGDIEIPFRKLMNLNRASTIYQSKPNIDELISIVLEEEATSHFT
jgi:hypothetical protein